MKIEYGDNNLIVFLNNKYISKIDFFNERMLENYFRDLFIRFKDLYNIDINGSYEIDVYIDDNYGVVLTLLKDDLDYFDYYDGQIDMKIVISKYKQFLYRMKNDDYDFIKKKCNIYLYDGCFYALPKKCSYVELGRLIENSDIVYGASAFNIINHGKCIASCK